MQIKPLSALVVGLLLSAGAQAAPSFVNGLAISGGMLDLSAGSDTDRRVGYFSDIYYDPNRNEWWGLSDRGPGGGTLNYETRVQRFTLSVDNTTGAISNFQIAQTIKFSNVGNAMNGLAPSNPSVLGNSFDPEGFVVNPKNGNFLVSDEYGSSLHEFNRNGELVRQYTIPGTITPKVGTNTDYNSTPPTLTSGREPNRGFEGLAISPDGKYAYAMLQNGGVQDGWTGSSRGVYTRIVKFDLSEGTPTGGTAVAQYAYKLESSGQGRGISSLVAINDHEFMVLERNNRGVGVGATFSNADKNVFKIDLTGASDVTGISLPSTGELPAGYTAVSKDTTKFIDLDANLIDLDGDGDIESLGKSPEKWEGLAIGPQLADGSFLLLAGTDNDYSVTQDAGSVQYDVWFNFNNADPYASSIQCPMGSTIGCTGTLTANHKLLPGVLHAYKVSAADLGGYTAPVPEPETYALMLAGLGLVGFMARRRKA